MENKSNIRKEGGKTIAEVVVNLPEGIGLRDFRKLVNDTTDLRSFLSGVATSISEAVSAYQSVEAFIESEKFKIPLHGGDYFFVPNKTGTKLEINLFSYLIDEKEKVQVSVNGTTDKHKNYIKNVCEYLASHSENRGRALAIGM